MHNDQVVTVFKALADKTRLSIVRTLVKKSCDGSFTEVSSCSSLSQPAMSHHFIKLVEAGVLIERKDGKQKFYELNTDLLAQCAIDPQKL